MIIRLPFKKQNKTGGLTKSWKNNPRLVRGGAGEREKELASTRRVSPCTTPLALSNVLKASHSQSKYWLTERGQQKHLYRLHFSQCTLSTLFFFFCHFLMPCHVYYPPSPPPIFFYGPTRLFIYLFIFYFYFFGIKSAWHFLPHNNTYSITHSITISFSSSNNPGCDHSPPKIKASLSCQMTAGHAETEAPYSQCHYYDKCHAHMLDICKEKFGVVLKHSTHMHTKKKNITHTEPSLHCAQTQCNISLPLSLFLSLHRHLRAEMPHNLSPLKPYQKQPDHTRLSP